MKKFLASLVKNKYALYAAGGVISAALVIGIFIYNKDAFIKIWTEVGTGYLFLCTFCAAAIYVSMGLSLWEVLRAMGRRINIGSVIGIALVSTTVNYLVSSFGVSGFALRAHLLGRKKIPLGMSVTASIVLTVIIYFVLAIIILQGSILMFLNSNATPKEFAQNFLLIIGMTAVCGFITVFLFNNDFRITWVRKIFRFVNRLSYKLFSAIIPKARFDNFSQNLETGINFIQQKKGRLTKAVLYVCADWLFTILVLYFAFRAVGVSVPAGVLVTGFAIGMATTLIPILPGGIGAMEIAMTAVFAKAGIAWEAALSATLIYRFMYYILPGLVSVFIYWGLQISNGKSDRVDSFKKSLENVAHHKIEPTDGEDLCGKN
ncbi:lysylphosphatidylglycerol synthase transmembrane domain-containing protein [Elusimicrobium minutum]|nr:lysylphosphatidylglycerol synthase transmembrane domain-containing protein [Elusimicrobium minutum]